MITPAASVRARRSCSPNVFAVFAAGRLLRILSAASNSLVVELLADQLAQRTGSPARSECRLRQRRGEAVQVPLHLVLGRRKRALARRIVREEARRQAHGADVERPRPRRPALGRPDDGLGRAAPDVDDGDAPGGKSGSGDGAGEGELTLFVRREDAHRRASGRQERAHELVAVGALATRGGDDHLDRRCAEAARRVDEARHALGGLVDARRGEAPVPLDVLAEEQVLATLVQRDEAGAVMAGHQKADGIRAYVDDGNVHSVVILQSPSAVTLSS